MRISGLLFDKDGTLLDYHATWMPLNRAIALLAAHDDAALADRLLVHGGYDAATGRVRANSPLAAGTPAEVAANFEVVLGRPVRHDLWAEVERLMRTQAGQSVLVPDAAASLAKLRKHTHSLGIATSDSVRGIQASLAPHDILHHFDFLAGYDSGHGIKPGPGMALAFCAARALEPAQICVIGDNLHDIDMGRAAGAGLVVGVLTGTSTAADLAGQADMVFAGIADMASDAGFLAMLAPA